MGSSQERVTQARLLGGRVIFIGMSAEDALERKRTLKLAVKDRVKNITTKLEENAEGILTVKRLPTQDTISNADILEVIASLAHIYFIDPPQWFESVTLSVTKEQARAFAKSLVEEASKDLPEEFLSEWNKAVPGREFNVFEQKILEAVNHIMDYYDERYNEIKAFDASKGPRKKTEAVAEVGEF